MQYKWNAGPKPRVLRIGSLECSKISMHLGMATLPCPTDSDAGQRDARKHNFCITLTSPFLSSSPFFFFLSSKGPLIRRIITATRHYPNLFNFYLLQTMLIMAIIASINTPRQHSPPCSVCVCLKNIYKKFPRSFA